MCRTMYLPQSYQDTGPAVQETHGLVTCEAIPADVSDHRGTNAGAKTMAFAAQ